MSQWSFRYAFIYSADIGFVKYPSMPALRHFSLKLSLVYAVKATIFALTSFPVAVRKPFWYSLILLVA